MNATGTSSPSKPEPLQDEAADLSKIERVALLG
jgi:hypothetical protein